MLERVWRKGIHLHIWWEFKLVQPLWGTVWRFLKKLKIELSYDPTRPWRRAWQCTPVFLPGASPWTEEPCGLHSMGLQRVRRDWADKHSIYNLTTSPTSGEHSNLKRYMHPNIHSSTIYEAKTRQQSKYPSTDEWIKMSYVYVRCIRQMSYVYAAAA